MIFLMNVSFLCFFFFLFKKNVHPKGCHLLFMGPFLSWGEQHSSLFGYIGN